MEAQGQKDTGGCYSPRVATEECQSGRERANSSSEDPKSENGEVLVSGEEELEGVGESAFGMFLASGSTYQCGFSSTWCQN